MSTTRYFKDSEGSILELEEIDGVLYPRYSDNLAQQLQLIHHMKVRDDDVILCTYPKAGTHWLWEILNMLRNKSSRYSPDTKRSAMLENSNLHDITSQSSPRVLNTHLLPHVLPEMTWRSRCRLVVCHRNPKDTIVSLYNMAKQVSYQKIRSAFEGSFEGYASFFLNGTVPHGSWYRYVRAWEEVRRQMPADRLLVTSYEGMQLDPVGETYRLAEFLGNGASASLCKDIADACSFDKLKTASCNKKAAKGPSIWKPNSTGIFRKGKVGDWRSWLSSDMSEQFDKAFHRQLSDLNLHFKYEI